MSKTLFAIALLYCSTVSAQSLPAARPAAIRAHLNFLADDLLEGRGTGTRGYDIAAKYVAAALESYGLEPGGDQGTFYQQVPLRRIIRNDAAGELAITRGDRPIELLPGSDYLLGPSLNEPVTTSEGGVVFVGYGITAPERDHDDYKGIDARGKFVLFFSGAPKSFPPTLAAHYGSEKYRNAEKHGAIGYITIRTQDDEDRYSWQRLTEGRRFPLQRVLTPEGAVIEGFPGLRGTGTLSISGARKLLAGAGQDYDKLVASRATGTKSVDLPLRVRMKRVATHEKVTSPNIAAVLRGSDPKLRDEYVVYSTHLDHMGIAGAGEGDRIYNGAYDNASGSAALLEVARMFSTLSPRPKRSVMFLFVTGEEDGLNGSKYFAQYPTVPIDHIVANLNIDGLTMMYPVRDVVALGADHSSLGAAAALAAADAGLEVSPDPFPEQMYFVRSDQYSFVKQGIPALYADAGLKSEPGFDAKAIAQEWNRTRYHTAGDDLTQSFDYASGARLVTYHFAAGYRVANATERPRWNVGDFFGDTFGKK